jgi:uncharacterized protein
MTPQPYIARTLSFLLPDGTQPFLTLVTGARQVGKTTTLRHTYPEMAYLNLDSIENREFLRHQKTSYWRTAPGAAIIDEIQKQPDLMEKIKYAWDAGEIDRTVMTGSSQILLLRQVRETLAGRVRLLELFPLSPAELGATTDNEGSKTLISSLCAGILDLDTVAPALSPDMAAPLQAAEDYIYQWGGMPALLTMKDTERKQWLADYRSTYLQRDLSDLARLSDLLPFARFQRFVALRAASLVNYADLARDSGVAAETARRYFEYLRISYQTEFLMPWCTNQTKRMVKSPKIIILDMGILRSLTGGWELDSGELFENFIIAEMVKHIRTLKAEVELFFWRSSGGAEVDILIKTPLGIWGLEVKSRDHASSQDARHLRSLAEDFGKQWLGGIVLYRGSTIEQLEGPNIHALPSWRLWGA